MTNEIKQGAASARRRHLSAPCGVSDHGSLMTSTISAHVDDTLIVGCEPCGRFKLIRCADLNKRGLGEWTLGRIVTSLACRRGPNSCGLPPTSVTIETGDQHIELPVRARPMTEVELGSI